MKQIPWVTVLPCLMVTLSCTQAQAITFTETIDAGETLNSGQFISSGSQPLTSISGILDGDADVFKVFLTGSQTFSATTINLDTIIGIPIDDLLGAPNDFIPDPQLFLFDEFGKGIYANDDSFGSPQATLPSGSFSPTKSGFYFLAISSSGYNPVSMGGNIFPTQPSTDIFGATGNGGGFPLTGFEGNSATRGRYAIALTGVQTTPQAIPEPSSILGILTLGIFGIVSRLKKRG
jgi:PEP-CTERM motif